MNPLHEVGLSTASSAGAQRGSTIRLTLGGLIALCVSLVATSVGITHFLQNWEAKSVPESAKASENVRDSSQIKKSGEAWGDLVTIDMEIQQPEEYVSFDTTSEKSSAWVFPGQSLGQVKDILRGSGLSEAQVAAATADGRVTNQPDATILKPDETLVFSLKPEVRRELYLWLGRSTENKFMNSPYHLPGSFSEMARRSGVSGEVISMVEKLTYHNSGIRFFSDPGVVLAKIKTREEQLRLLKALTYQTAVLARLHVDGQSDLDKIVGYWGSVPGVREKDIRPLLESVSRTNGGGTISLLYLLPKFARERLYTFPMPTQNGDTEMDCHWTALNFLNETPDHRLQDSAFASQFIKDNFYQIGKPSKCGDVMFVLDSSGGVIHSAVYIADDIVFTKNGVNYAQPWILMRTKDLMDVYTREQAPSVLYYRRKDA